MTGFSRSDTPATVQPLDPAEAITMAAEGRLTVIDVREPAELAETGQAEGALHIPMAVLPMKTDPASPEKLPQLSTSEPVAIYCALGGRAQKAAEALVKMGYEQVFNIGGFADWQKAGGPVSR